MGVDVREEWKSRYEHDFGVYPNVFGGELFNGTTSENISRAVLSEFKMAAVKTEIMLCYT